MSEDVPRRSGEALSQVAIGFDGFVIEPGRGRLLGRDGNEIALRPKAFDVLLALIEADGGPLGKTQLLDRVWARLHVTEDSLFQAVKDIRRAIEDKEGRLLRTVPRRGYMLDCALTRTDIGAARSTPATPAAALPMDRPSIAVLPFRCLGESASDYLASGLVEEIAIALSRFRWLFVLGNASAVAMADAADHAAATDSFAALRERGIRYLVDGSLAETTAGIVVRCRLIETATERQVWQERFTSEASDILHLYEVITSAIASAIEPRLLRAEIERVLRRSTTSLDAFDCYLRALPGYYSRTPRGNSEAIAFLETALARDPHFALATALLARCVATDVWLGTEPDFAAGSARALALARAALNEDRSDPQVLALCGHLLVLIGGEHAEGGSLLDLSLQINPNSAEAWRLGGWVAAWCGETDLALDRLKQSERLDPLSPLQADVHSARSLALLLAGRFADAVEAARRSIATTPESTAPRRFLIAALWSAGEQDEAKRECAALLARQPNASLRRSGSMQRLKQDWMFNMLIDALRAAGLPE